MYYIPVMFTSGLQGQYYQRVVDGEVVAIVDASDDPVEVPEVCEYHVNGDLTYQLP